MQETMFTMYEGLKNVYLSSALTGDSLLLPSKYIHKNFGGLSTTEGRVKMVAYRLFDMFLQLAFLPLTLVGCSIKLLTIKSFNRTSVLLKEDALRRFESIQELWKTNFKSFERHPLGSHTKRLTDEDYFVSTSVTASDLQKKEACERFRERVEDLITEGESKFWLLTGIGNIEGRTPSGEPTYGIALYFQGP